MLPVFLPKYSCYSNFNAQINPWRPMSTITIISPNNKVPWVVGKLVFRFYFLVFRSRYCGRPWGLRDRNHRTCISRWDLPNKTAHSFHPNNDSNHYSVRLNGSMWVLYSHDSMIIFVFFLVYNKSI